MKLINPTDNELNFAFLKYVAKGQLTEDDKHCERVLTLLMREKDKSYSPPNLANFVPGYVRNMNAVLPWLEKWETVTISIGLDVSVLISETCSLMSCPLKENGVTFISRDTPEALSRAAVIALLRAHGVEVEFTK